jgi:hypothetical protein
MAVNATFTADFSDFLTAIDQAEVALVDFGKGASTVEKKLNQMVDNFSGRKLIQEASLLTIAVEKAGGVAALTAKELEVVGNKANEAADKMHRLGYEVPAGLQKLATAANTSTTATGGLVTQTRAFDSLLQQVGVNITPVSKAIDEIASSAGQSASQLGLMGSAGLVVGAAMAGWEFGRAIAGFLDLDRAVEETWQAILGLPSAWEQAAGAIDDELLRLEKGTARYRSQAVESAIATKAWADELKLIPDLDQLTKDLDSHNFSLQTLSARYGVSVEALQFFTREQRNAAEATRDAAKAEKDAADAIHASNTRKLKEVQQQIDATKAFDAAMVELNSAGQGWQGTLDTISGTVVEAVKYYLQAGVSQKTLAEAYALTDAQVKAIASSLKDDAQATKDAAAAHDQLTASAEATAKAYEKEAAAAAKLRKDTEDAAAAIEKLKAANRAMGNSTQYDLSSESGRAAVPEGIRVWLHDGYSLAQAAQIDFLMRWGLPINANDPLFAQKGPRVPGFAGGVENFGGGWAMVGERGPELVNLPRGSDVIPAGAGGVAIYNTFQIVDTEAGLARRISGEIMQQIKRGKQLGL